MTIDVTLAQARRRFLMTARSLIARRTQSMPHVFTVSAFTNNAGFVFLRPINSLHSLMVRIRHYFQIIYSVVLSIAVLVMDNFPPMKMPAKFLFRNETMLEYVSLLIAMRMRRFPYPDIAVAIQPLSATPIRGTRTNSTRSIARMGAILSICPGRVNELFPAIEAGKLLGHRALQSSGVDAGGVPSTARLSVSSIISQNWTVDHTEWRAV